MIHFTAHTFKCVCHCRRAMFRVLGMYNFGKGQEVWAQSVPLIGTQLIFLPKSGGGAKLPPCSSDPIAQWGINLILMNKDISTVPCCNFNWFLFSFFSVSSFFFAPYIVNFYFITYLILEWIQYSYQRMFLVCACWSFKNANAKEQSCDFRWHL